MIAAVSHFTSGKDARRPKIHEIDSNWRQVAKAWAQILKTVVKHGANPTLQTAKHRKLPGHPRLSTMLIIDEYFPGCLPEEAAEL
jgi:hypothetical protein